MCSSKQPHRLWDMWIVQYWSVVFKMWFTMFTKHQGHKGHHPSQQLLFKASFKAYITKRSKQLNRVLHYIQQHSSLRSRTQQSRLTQSCLLLSPQLQLPEPSEASGTTWSFLSVIQHQGGCRRPDPAYSPSFCCCGWPCQKQRLWTSDLMRICAASCSVNSRQLQLGAGCWQEEEEQNPPTAEGWRRNYPTRQRSSTESTFANNR